MTDSAKFIALFGDPVAHSLSPRIHLLFSQQTGVPLEYWPQLVKAEDFADALEALKHHGGAGLNVTVPHKAKAFQFCETLSVAARVSGAVNTMLLKDDGWYGENTDGDGALWDLETNLGWKLADRAVIIIGAGGAAAGLIAPLLQARAGSITIASRRVEQAQQLIDSLDLGDKERLSACALADVVIPADSLLINATSCGHQGQCPDLPKPGSGTQAYDVNYGDAATPFLEWAKKHGISASDGLGMLVGQAAWAFRLWTDHFPNPQPVLASIRLWLDEQGASPKD